MRTRDWRLLAAPLITACSLPLIAAPEVSSAEDAESVTQQKPNQEISGSQPTDTASRSDGAQKSGAMPTAIEEIVVTAQKRTERLQDVPQAITYVSGEQIQQQNVADIRDLEKTSPSLTASAGSTAKIRGLGAQTFSRSAEGAVGVVLDGVPQGGLSGGSGALTLFDIRRVEILMGPQGTLFGRNSSAGLIQVVTNEPDLSAFDTAFHWELGTRDAARTQGMVNVPVSDNLGFRLTASQTRPANTVYNIPSRNWDDQTRTGTRGRMLYQPTDNLTLHLLADYEQTENDGGLWAVYQSTPGTAYTDALNACGIVPNPESVSTCTAGARYANNKIYGGSFQAEYQLGDYAITSISAVREAKRDDGGDADDLPVNAIDRNGGIGTNKFFSQELRLASPAGDRVEYVAGVYYYNADQEGVDTIMGALEGTPFAGAIPEGAMVGTTTLNEGSSESLAVFGQATLSATDRFDVILGARYEQAEVESTSERLLADGAIAPFPIAPPGVNAGRIDDNDFSYRAGLRYRFSDELMTYVTYTRGYKGAAINDQDSTAENNVVVGPEIPKSWEAGIKSTLLDGRLGANLSIFRNKVEDFQAQVFNPEAVAFVLQNVPSILSQGVELMLIGSVSDRISLGGGVTYLDATYGPGYIVGCNAATSAEGCNFFPDSTSGTFDAEGRRLTATPKWKGVVNAEYRQPVLGNWEAYVHSDLVYTSRLEYAANINPNLRLGERFALGARIGIRSNDGRFGGAIFGRNLLDQFTPASRFATPAAGFFGDPNSHSQFIGPESVRIFGVALDYRFY